MTRPTLSELELLTDGPISREDRMRADGVDPVLSDSRGAVRFWRDQLEKAKEAYRACTDPRRHLSLQATEDHARAGLKRAEERLRVLEGPVAFGRDVFGGLLK